MKRGEGKEWGAGLQSKNREESCQENGSTELGRRDLVPRRFLLGLFQPRAKGVYTDLGAVGVRDRAVGEPPKAPHNGQAGPTQGRAGGAGGGARAAGGGARAPGGVAGGRGKEEEAEEARPRAALGPAGARRLPGG